MCRVVRVGIIGAVAIAVRGSAGCQDAGGRKIVEAAHILCANLAVSDHDVHADRWDTVDHDKQQGRTRSQDGSVRRELVNVQNRSVVDESSVTCL